MNRELDMLRRLGLDDLILTLWDIHRFAINNGHLAMITGAIRRLAGGPSPRSYSGESSSPAADL